MFLGRIAGTVVSTVKDDALRTHKLLLVQPLDQRGNPLTRTLVALDAVGAGAGEVVYCCRGKEASFSWLPQSVPTDVAIVGIVDSASNRDWLPGGDSQ
ncbi:MAG: EutN/CcmL family microcompartment protein [Terriglobales bacterium]